MNYNTVSCRSADECYTDLEAQYNDPNNNHVTLNTQRWQNYDHSVFIIDRTLFETDDDEWLSLKDSNGAVMVDNFADALNAALSLFMQAVDDDDMAVLSTAMLFLYSAGYTQQEIKTQINDRVQNGSIRLRNSCSWGWTDQYRFIISCVWVPEDDNGGLEEAEAVYTTVDFVPNRGDTYNDMVHHLLNTPNPESNPDDKWLFGITVKCTAPINMQQQQGGVKRLLQSHVRSNIYTCLQTSMTLAHLYEFDYPLYKLINVPSAGEHGSEEFDILTEMVNKLSSEAKVDTNRMCGPPEAARLCQAMSRSLNRKPVVLFCWSIDPFKVMWTTCSDIAVLTNPRTFFIDVRLHDCHFTPVNRVHKLLGGRKFCRVCQKTYSHDFNHICRGPKVPKGYVRCSSCYSFTDHKLEAYKRQQTTPSYECHLCHCLFWNQECLANHRIHKLGKKTVCDSKWTCTECNKSFLTSNSEGREYGRFIRPEDHKCNTVYCNVCKKWKPPHRCYMQVEEPRKLKNPVYYYDFETVAVEGKFEPVVCVIQNEEGKEWMFYALQDTCKFMEKHKGVYIAHNAMAFDSHILLSYFSTVKPPLRISFNACRGNKLLDVSIKKGPVDITLRDSLAFLPFALAKFESAFNLDVGKQFYPYQFANLVGPTLDYKGPVPAREYFNQAQAGFEEWYTSQQDKTFDLKQLTQDYCRADVTVLRLGCEAFRAAFKKSGVDPFAVATIASACQNVFNSRYLIPNSLEIITKAEHEEMSQALSGGRTGACKLYYKCQPDEKIFYVDYTSLYPYVNTVKEYPSGEHQRLDFGPEGKAFAPEDLIKIGLSKVDVDCPSDLHIPLLQSYYMSDSKQRKLRFDLLPKQGLWYDHFSLRRAVELGYVIKRIYTSYVWDTSTFGFGGSRQYMKAALKKKLTNSGWPQGLDSDGKAKYVRDIFDKEGIQLNPDEISYNPAMRLVGKLEANCLWGKMAMKCQDTYKDLQILHDNAEGNKFLNEKLNLLTNFHILNPKTGVFEFTRKGTMKSDDLCLKRAVYQAVFTTAHARLVLFELLHKLGKRVIYFDTDSCIFHWKPGEWRPPLGEFVGDLTNEHGNPLTYEGFATEVVCSGPKSYAIKWSDCKEKIVVKGHSLKKGDAARQIRFDRLKDIVFKLGQGEPLVITYPHKITRSRTFGLYLKEKETKILQYTFDKRVIDEVSEHQITTVPFA